MADVYAIFGTLLAVGIVFPGMLCAWWLIFPNVVKGAQIRFQRSPRRCFGFGVLLAILIGIPSTLFVAIPFGLANFIGGALIIITLTLASLGASGITAEMGHRLHEKSAGRVSPVGNFVRAAVALELAAAFPLIGWFLVIPLTIITSLGAFGLGLFRWEPKPTPQLVPDAPAPQV